MLNELIDRMVKRTPMLDATAMKISRAIHQVVLDGGAPTRTIADILHGVGVGHPLHVILTDFAIGGWTAGGLLDALWLIQRHRYQRRAANLLITAGTISAIPTALTGMADFTTIPQRAGGVGLIHALVNTLNLALFGTSLILRRNNRREPAAIVSLVALGTLTISAYLGGHLAHAERVGTNRDEPVDAIPNWTPIADYQSLRDQEPRTVMVNGHPVLLYRQNDSVYAISALCSHDAGQLEEGKFEQCTVECPLHQSVFDLRNGHVVHGPATQAVTAYQVRIREQKVEVKLDTASG